MEPRFILLSLIKLKNYVKLVQKHILQNTKNVFIRILILHQNTSSVNPYFSLLKECLPYEQKT